MQNEHVQCGPAYPQERYLTSFRHVMIRYTELVMIFQTLLSWNIKIGGVKRYAIQREPKASWVPAVTSLSGLFDEVANELCRLPREVGGIEDQVTAENILLVKVLRGSMKGRWFFACCASPHSLRYY